MKHFKAFKAAAFFLAALLSFSCNTEIIDPGVDPVVNPETPTSKYVTIPVLFNLSAGINTKVTLNSSDKYTFVDGDVVYFKNDTYEISGYVVYDAAHETGPWEGRMKYNGAHDFDSVIKTASLNAVLVGSGSTLLATTYDSDLAHAFPTDLGSPDYSTAVAADLATAVQNFSYFTTSFTYAQATTSGGSSNSIALQQQSCFVNFTLNLQYSLDDGDSYNLLIKNGDTNLSSGTVSVSDNSASFCVAFYGGQSLASSKLYLGDVGSEKKLLLSDNDKSYFSEKTIPNPTGGTGLVANKKYTVTRKAYLAPALGDAYYSDGSWGNNYHGGAATVIGIVAYVNEGGTNDDAITEASTVINEENVGGHALVLALQNCVPQTAIGSSDQWKAPWDTKGNEVMFSSELVTTTNLAYTNFSGYAKTLQLKDKIYNEEYRFPSAYYAANYENTVSTASTHSTGWFLPGIGQWLAVVYGACGANKPNDTDNPWVVNENTSTSWDNGSIGNLFRIGEGNYWSGLNGILESYSGKIIEETSYWTSSENSGSYAIRMNFGIKSSNSTIKVDKNNKSTAYKVRPFLAF